MSNYEEIAADLLGGWDFEKRSAVFHDMPLIMKAIDEFAANEWHSTAYEIIMAEIISADRFPELAEVIGLAQLMNYNLPALLIQFINEAFGVGYILGEGVEHIEKCYCHQRHQESDQN